MLEQKQHWQDSPTALEQHKDSKEKAGAQHACQQHLLDSVHGTGLLELGGYAERTRTACKIWQEVVKRSS